MPNFHHCRVIFLGLSAVAALLASGCQSLTPLTLIVVRDQLTKAPAVSYELIVNNPEPSAVDTQPTPSAQKVWLEAGKMRVETVIKGNKVVNISNPDNRTRFIYYPDLNTATILDFTIQSSYKNVYDRMQEMVERNPEGVRVERVNGLPTTVFKYKILEGDATLWIDHETIFPVRLEIVGSAGQTVFFWQSVVFRDVDDYQFVIPAGVRTFNVSDIAEDLQNASPPTPAKPSNTDIEAAESDN